MIPSALRSRLGEAPGGVFFLHGEDDFRKSAAARGLVDAHLDPATRDFNLDVVRGDEVDLETLASVTGTPPMMAEWRVVLVREAQGLASSPRSRDLILGLVEAPPPGLALVLVATIPSGSKARFYEDLKKKARAARFPAVSDADVPGWLMEWSLESHGVRMEEEAARALASGLGTDLGLLAREVEKLALRGEEGEPITLEVVREAGTRLPRQDRWQWFDMVGERRFREALRALPVLLAHGESGVGLAIGLSTQLLRVGVAREGGARALEGVLPRHQRWLAKRLLAQSRGWKGEELEEAIEDLRRVDRLLKSTAFDDAHVMEEWLLRRLARTGRESVA